MTRIIESLELTISKGYSVEKSNFFPELSSSRRSRRELESSRIERLRIRAEALGLRLAQCDSGPCLVEPLKDDQGNRIWYPLIQSRELRHITRAIRYRERKAELDAIAYALDDYSLEEIRAVRPDLLNPCGGRVSQEEDIVYLTLPASEEELQQFFAKCHPSKVAFVQERVLAVNRMALESMSAENGRVILNELMEDIHDFDKP